MEKKALKELAAYVRNNVEDYEDYLKLALNRMERMRYPFEMAADAGFYSDLLQAIEDWCDDEEVDFYELDLDEVIDYLIWID